jgi:succinate dehydrogenase flavin-adding protein (antitoxin of CptAB toxin-antitoxin module)
MTARAKLLPLAALLLLGVAVFAQFRGSRFGGGFRGEGNFSGSGFPKTAREAEQHSNETPMWTNAHAFKKDVFTFCRIRYSSWYGGRSRGGWSTDFPDADLNLSYRLQQMTSLKVDPLGRLLEIEDPDLFDYPWVYMVEVGALRFKDEEVAIMRKYLLNG